MTQTAPSGGIGVLTCQTAFGWVGFAWCERGLVSVTLPQQTEAGAFSLLPEARDPVPEATPGLDVFVLVDKLIGYFQGEGVTFDEPLDPTIGTDFLRRVWAIIRAISPGQTRTYGSISIEAGSPGAARAVGQAMARNPWPIIVPCHRVVGSDGSLTGFGGGLSMKRKMLEMEGVKLAPSVHQQSFDWDSDNPSAGE